MLVGHQRHAAEYGGDLRHPFPLRHGYISEPFPDRQRETGPHFNLRLPGGGLLISQDPIELGQQQVEPRRRIEDFGPELDIILSGTRHARSVAPSAPIRGDR